MSDANMERHAVGSAIQESENLGAQLLSVFDHVYVINLEHREDRRREIAEQLAKVGLSFAQDKVAIFPAVRPDDQGKFPSVGARGCFLSHLGVLRDALENGYETILVLEDDADFVANFQRNALRLCEALQREDWGMLYGFRPPDRRTDDNAAPVEDIPPDLGVQCTHCLGFRRSVIARIIPYFETILERPGGHPEGGPMHVDGAFSWFRKTHPDAKTKMVGFEFMVQRPSKTDIHELRWYDKIALLAPMLALGRRAKQILRNR